LRKPRRLRFEPATEQERRRAVRPERPARFRRPERGAARGARIAKRPQLNPAGRTGITAQGFDSNLRPNRSVDARFDPSGLHVVEDPRALHVLGQECDWNRTGPETYFVCPAAALDEEKEYYGWRAGLRRRDDGSWEFAWFIAGN